MLERVSSGNTVGWSTAPNEASTGSVVRFIPRLSVIIPHLNEPHNLLRCLQALERQRDDGLPFEIIVVDNGSTVPPEAICREFAGVYMEQELVPGPGPARNRGAARARASLLAFIDADCIAQRGWVRGLVEAMDHRPEIDFAGGDIGILATDPKGLSGVEAFESIFSYRADLYARRGHTATGNMVVRARVFSEVGPFGGITTMEDTEWGLRATSRGYKLAYLPSAKVLTPSCKSFAELARRWDRHVAHEFRKVGRSQSMLGWLARAGAVALSPLADVRKIVWSDRISGVATRCRAFVCLVRIRCHRAGKMLRLAIHRDAETVVGRWNRETPVSRNRLPSDPAGPDASSSAPSR